LWCDRQTGRDQRELLKKLDALPTDDAGQVILPATLNMGRFQVQLLTLGRIVTDRESFVRFGGGCD
jgi:alkyl hydroperoxide reductase subunit AhpC